MKALLTSAQDGGEWSASRLSHFTPSERTPGTQWIGSWVGPRAGLHVEMKRKIPNPCWDSNFWTFCQYPSTIPLSYPSSYPILKHTTKLKTSLIDLIYILE
jgi:hypothetical protein